MPVLLALGSLLIVIDIHAVAGGWPADHVCLVGLLDGAAGFCFGIPIASVAIKELTRRSAEAARVRQVVAEFADQLRDCEQNVSQLTSQQTERLGGQLRELADVAAAAQLSAEIDVDIPFAQVWIFAVGAVTVTARLCKEYAARLRAVIQNDRRWALIGFICSNLARAAPQLRTVVELRSLPWHEEFDRLLSALQVIAVQRIPAAWRWLGHAASDKSRTRKSFSGWHWTSPLSPVSIDFPATKVHTSSVCDS
jgi:hypothetical protein